MISKTVVPTLPTARTILVTTILSLLIPLSISADGDRIALIIGNGNYQTNTVSPLQNPPNDARDVSRALQEIDFEVRTIIDGTREEMAIAITDFGHDIRQAEVGLFYYAGHGVQVDGRNYLIPVDADLPSSAVVPYRTVAADEVISLMAEAESEVNLFFLDACRDNPLPQVSRTLTRGLAPISRRPQDTLVVYATGPNDVAEDGTGRNSPFTQAFLSHIATPNQDVFDLYRNITADVIRYTNGQQKPEQMGSFSRRFALIERSGHTSTPERTRQQPRLETEPTVGSVRVSVATPATLYLDGDRIGEIAAGRTATISEVETGSRRIEVRYPDGERENKTLSVRDSVAATVRFSYEERAEVQAPEYSIGDRGPAGGIVFYDRGDDTPSGYWRYLEAWTSDEGSYRWGSGMGRVGDTSPQIGLGYQNTYTHLTGNHPAAAAVRRVSHGGYDDWFLPSKSELELMYEHREIIGGFATSFWSITTYWSSSESFRQGRARALDFRTGNWADDEQETGNVIRVIRRFSTRSIR